MRIFPLSDLHLERRPLAAIPTPRDGFDVLVCAGDLWEGRPEAGVEAVAALSGGRPAVIVPGNHEHYRSGSDDPRTAPELLGALETAAAREGIPVLRGGGSVVIGGVRFVGATLWSDWSLASRWSGLPEEEAVARAAARVSGPDGSREYRGAILAGGGAPWSPADAVAAHRRDAEAMLRALDEPHPGPVVAVTHHPPLARIVDPYRGAPGVPWWVPAFYASRVLERVPERARPGLWISGHFHAGHDFRVGRTRCVANPVEGGSYDPERVVTISSARA